MLTKTCVCEGLPATLAPRSAIRALFDALDQLLALVDQVAMHGIQLTDIDLGAALATTRTKHRLMRMLGGNSDRAFSPSRADRIC